MKIATTIIATLLGLGFIAFGSMGLSGFQPKDPPPMSAEAMAFAGAMATSGYMKFVGLIEVLGGLMTIIPRTRNIGLLFIGPVIVNILAFHTFLDGGKNIAPGLVLAVLAVFVLYTERRTWAGLVTRAPSAV